MDDMEQKNTEQMNQDDTILEVNQPDSYYQPQAQAQPEPVYHAAPGEYYDLSMHRAHSVSPADVQSQGYPQPQGCGQPQMYAQPQPQGYGQPQMYAQPQPQMYGQPQIYAQPQPQGYGQPQMYAQPQPQGYGQPQGYPQPQMYAQPQPMTGMVQGNPMAGVGSYYDPSPSVGRNVTCLVFGILSFFTGFAVRDDGVLSPSGIVIALLFMILSVVFGILGLSGKTRGKGMSIAGLICTGFGILFSILSFANVIQ